MSGLLPPAPPPLLLPSWSPESPELPPPHALSSPLPPSAAAPSPSPSSRRRFIVVPDIASPQGRPECADALRSAHPTGTSIALTRIDARMMHSVATLVGGPARHPERLSGRLRHRGWCGLRHPAALQPEPQDARPRGGEC